MRMEEKDFEPAGLIPRSIVRTVERFQQQLRPETIALGIQEFRISRYQVRVSVRYLLILLFLPICLNWGATNLIIKPLVGYFWNTHRTSLFLNSYQAERAFQEMRDFESQLFFEMLLSSPEHSTNSTYIVPQKELSLQTVQQSSAKQEQHLLLTKTHTNTDRFVSHHHSFNDTSTAFEVKKQQTPLLPTKESSESLKDLKESWNPKQLYNTVGPETHIHEISIKSFSKAFVDNKEQESLCSSRENHKGDFGYLNKFNRHPSQTSADYFGLCSAEQKLQNVELNKKYGYKNFWSSGKANVAKEEQPNSSNLLFIPQLNFSLTKKDKTKDHCSSFIDLPITDTVITPFRQLEHNSSTFFISSDLKHNNGFFESSSFKVLPEELTKICSFNADLTKVHLVQNISKASVQFYEQDKIHQPRHSFQTAETCFAALFQKKTVLLAEIYNQQSITALSNMFGDCIMVISTILLLRWNAPQFTILKSFLIESFYSFNDAIKCFYIILITDFLVGFHSPRGWEIAMEMLLRHLGLPEDEEFILLFVGTFPVFLDTAFKYWIFRYLNKISPSTVATYHSMIE